ncbi:MAG: hypothetical protein ACJ77K_11615 [Bacteroidia bacterium]
MDLAEITDQLRKRLMEYRQVQAGKEISSHINAIDISLSLTELGLRQIPIRKISKEEENWFRAGYHLSMVLENSEWEDLYNLYSKLVQEVEKQNYFR